MVQEDGRKDPEGEKLKAQIIREEWSEDREREEEEGKGGIERRKK